MNEKKEHIKKLIKEIEKSEKLLGNKFKTLVFLGDKGLGDRTVPFKTKDEFFDAFEKECLKVDDTEVNIKFKAFDNCIGNTGEHLETAAFIAEFELKDAVDKNEELNKIIHLTSELFKAFTWLTKTLKEYVSFSNTIYKPMQLLDYNKKYTITTEFIQEHEKGFTEMLEKVSPIFSYLNAKVKSSYKELTQMGIEVEKTGKAIRKTNKELKAFKSSDEKYSEMANIYVKVLRNSNRKPTVRALEIATNGRFSSVTWSRKLKHTSLLDAILEKLLKLMTNDRRVKDQNRKKFYTEVYNDLNKIYTDTLEIKLRNESKKNSQNIKNNSNRIAYNEYDNGYDNEDNEDNEDN